MPARLWSRMIAFFIDYILIGITVSCLIMACKFYIGYVDKNPQIIFAAGFILFVAAVLFKDVFGRSVGKRVRGLTIVSNSYEVVPKWKLILRNITFLVMPFELLVIGLSDENKRLTDMLLGLSVIEIPNLRRKKAGLI